MSFISTALPVAKDYLTCGPLIRSFENPNFLAKVWLSSTVSIIFTNGLAAAKGKSRSRSELISWIFYTLITTNLAAQAISSVLSHPAGLLASNPLRFSITLYYAAKMIDEIYYDNHVIQNLTGDHLTSETFSFRFLLHQIYVFSLATTFGGCLTGICSIVSRSMSPSHTVSI